MVENLFTLEPTGHPDSCPVVAIYVLMATWFSTDLTRCFMTQFMTQSLPSRGDAELPSKRNAVRGRTAPSRLQHQTRHLPAATVAEYACHASDLSATSGHAAGEGRTLKSSDNEAKPRRQDASYLGQLRNSY
ncbi:hypothetical protein Bbelb_255900 [Branchiostoma belcheri]|nr:hypothetical protein Bbelb_255900 [Branchiostoma belcheri]